jgi:hypothetical protein
VLPRDTVIDQRPRLQQYQGCSWWSVKYSIARPARPRHLSDWQGIGETGIEALAPPSLPNYPRRPTSVKIGPALLDSRFETAQPIQIER